jgi:potassium voltage-gated channel Shaw-related subfamily C protein 1
MKSHTFILQARAKLPKKRRRVIPVENLRPPHHPGVTQGPPSHPGGPVSGVPVTRRVNAMKQNNPSKDILSTPKMGE